MEPVVVRASARWCHGKDRPHTGAEVGTTCKIFARQSFNINFTLVDKAALWHPDQDGPEDDVEGGRVLKEDLETEEGKKLASASQLAINSVSGHKQDYQAMEGTKHSWWTIR